MIETLQPQTLRAWMSEARPFRLLDVREEVEWRIARLPGASLRPLSTLPQWLEEEAAAADPRPIVVYCHHGMRSARVCAALAAHGAQDVRNLAGGIERWSLEVDPAVPRY